MGTNVSKTAARADNSRFLEVRNKDGNVVKTSQNGMIAEVSGTIGEILPDDWSVVGIRPCRRVSNSKYTDEVVEKIPVDYILPESDKGYSREIIQCEVQHEDNYTQPSTRTGFSNVPPKSTTLRDDSFILTSSNTKFINVPPHSTDLKDGFTTPIYVNSTEEISMSPKTNIHKNPTLEIIDSHKHIEEHAEDPNNSVLIEKEETKCSESSEDFRKEAMYVQTDDSDVKSVVSNDNLLADDDQGSTNTDNIQTGQCLELCKTKNDEENEGGDTDEKEIIEDGEKTSIEKALTVEITLFAKTYEVLFDCSVAIQNLKPIKDFVTKMGFYNSFPTPKLLQQAQRTIRHFNIIPPKTDRGFPLPFPYSLPNNQRTNNSSSEETANILEGTDSFTKFVTTLKTMLTENSTEVKVHVIMRWMSEHNDEIPSADLNGTQPTIAGQIQAELFCKFCKMVSVCCMVIEGQRKTYSLQPDIDVENQSIKAKWCAVLIRGQWRLIDPSLPSYQDLESLSIPSSSSHDLPQMKQTKVIQRTLEEFYFLSDPTLFIYTHLPNEDYWQLLCRPVIKTEWQNIVCVSPFFLYHGFEIKSKTTYHVKIDDNYLSFNFTYPMHKTFRFLANIIPFSSQNSSQIHIESDMYVKMLCVQVYIPMKRNCVLHIFFQDLTDNNSDFSYLCSYSLNA